MADETLFKVEHLPSGMNLYSAVPNDKASTTADTVDMTELTRSELNDTLAAIEQRMDRRIDRMGQETDRRSEEYRREIALRDETIRRELDLRRESFLAEQAARDKALDEKFAGFLSAQSERDKRIDESVAGIKSEISRLGSLKLNIWGAMATTVGLVIAIAALAFGVHQAAKTSSQPVRSSSEAVVLETIQSKSSVSEALRAASPPPQ